MSTSIAASRSARWVFALGLLCVAALQLQFRNIAGTVPYPQHVDEAFLTGPAHRTLVTGTLHPYTFNYPSLPKYLVSAGMAVGFLRGVTDGGPADVRRIGNVGYPYYDTPLVVMTARQLYALLGSVTMIATATIAGLALLRPSGVFLAPLLLVVSPLFFFHSWVYLNVDLVGTTFTTLTLAACLAGARRPGLARAAVVPGLCAGFAAGSKYTLATVIVPVLLTVALFVPRPRRVAASLTALGAMVAAFLVVVPYSVIDIPGFLNGLASEAFHYASGHRGFQDRPGWPQLLFYGRHLASQFGVAGLFAVLGWCALLMHDWRRAAILSAFPVVLLGLLAGQRVHFTRNVLGLHPLIAVFAAAGLSMAHRWLVSRAARRGWSARLGASRTSAISGLLLVAAAVPWWHAVDEVRTRTDSRNVAQAWLRDHLPPQWAVVVPKELAFDARPLESAGRRVVAVSLQGARSQASLQELLVEVPQPAVMLLPRWGADARFPGGEVAVFLNGLSGTWRSLQTFGTRDVLVNYSYSNPWGDPAFSIVIVK